MTSSSWRQIALLGCHRSWVDKILENHPLTNREIWFSIREERVSYRKRRVMTLSDDGCGLVVGGGDNVEGNGST